MRKVVGPELDPRVGRVRGKLELLRLIQDPKVLERQEDLVSPAVGRDGQLARQIVILHEFRQPRRPLETVRVVLRGAAFFGIQDKLGRVLDGIHLVQPTAAPTGRINAKLLRRRLHFVFALPQVLEFKGQERLVVGAAADDDHFDVPLGRGFGRRHGGHGGWLRCCCALLPRS